MATPSRGRSGVEDADASMEGSIVASEATDVMATGYKVAAVDRIRTGKEEERKQQWQGRWRRQGRGSKILPKRAEDALTALDKAGTVDSNTEIHRQGRRRSSLWMTKREQGARGRWGRW
ncbi:hypothetical protein BHE74_00039033 [Ensete ventricosum]|nr:hypothetical protein BHE74_00039033 [Ensete ventricosum]